MYRSIACNLLVKHLSVQYKERFHFVRTNVILYRQFQLRRSNVDSLGSMSGWSMCNWIYNDMHFIYGIFLYSLFSPRHSNHINTFERVFSKARKIAGGKRNYCPPPPKNWRKQGFFFNKNVQWKIVWITVPQRQVHKQHQFRMRTLSL